MVLRGKRRLGSPKPRPGRRPQWKLRWRNFSVIAEPAQAPAGTVTFELTATGGFHNFVVIRTELAPDDLPLLSSHPTSSVDTVDGEGTEVIGLVPIPFEGEKELTVDAGPGDYVLICNAGDHYLRGMRTGFSVA
jgi:hypothetical protein